jgi:hypothetical protein
MPWSMRLAALLALGAVVLAACGGSSPAPIDSPGDDGGSAGDSASSTNDGGGTPGDAQGGGGNDAEAKDGAPADVGAPLDAGGHDSSTHVDAGCMPQCAGRSCGDDGCGGSCGTCPGGFPCDTQGQCGTCTPFCGCAVCGDDGCGGSCGTCPGQYTCVVNGTCQLDPGSVCGPATCGSAASCCHCNGTPTCFALPPGELCTDLGAGCM